MHWFYVDSEATGRLDNIAMLSPEDVHHAKDVLRLRIGEHVILSDQISQVHEGQIDQITNDTIAVKINSSRRVEVPKIDLAVYQSLPKGDKMDFVVQKCTEIGAASITPFTSQRTIVRLDAKKSQARLSRWRSIAKDSAALAFRDCVTRINDVEDFNAAVTHASECDLALVFWEGEAPALQKVLAESKSPDSIAVIIGPEGGLAPEEIKAMKEVGLLAVSMGRYVLRTETAALASLAMINYHYQNLFF